jgi:hypothetical protein
MAPCTGRTAAIQRRPQQAAKKRKRRKHRRPPKMRAITRQEANDCVIEGLTPSSIRGTARTRIQRKTCIQHVKPIPRVRISCLSRQISCSTASHSEIGIVLVFWILDRSPRGFSHTPPCDPIALVIHWDIQVFEFGFGFTTVAMTPLCETFQT